MEKIKEQLNNMIYTMYILYEYTTYNEYKKKVNHFYSAEDIIEMKKLYMINGFYQSISFRKFMKIVKDISIKTFQSPYTVITSLLKNNLENGNK